MRTYHATATIAVCLATLLVHTAPAAAQALHLRQINETVRVSSVISGVRGADNVTFTATEGTRKMIVTGVFFRERNNIPCWVRVEFDGLDLFHSNSGPVSSGIMGRTDSFDRCGATFDSGPARNRWQNSERGDRIDFLEGLPSQLSDGVGTVNLVTQIRACVRSGNDRLKGIRLGTRRLSATGLGNVTAYGHGSWNASPNCNGDWQAVSKCPGGRVATGVRVFYGPVSGLGGIKLPIQGARVTGQVTGLRLICSPMELTPAP